MTHHRRSPWKAALTGVIAGAAATAAMSAFQSAWTNFASADRKAPQDEDEPATVKSAEAVTQAATGHGLSPEGKKIAGPAMHWAFGIANGLLYSSLARHDPRVRMCAGTAFGTALWAAADEIAVPALGLSKPPNAFPPSVHLYGLASHLVFGFALDAAYQLADSRL